MCSRFWGPTEALLADVKVSESDSKVSPEELHGIIHLSHRKRVLSPMKWGFGARDKVPVINAWSEGLLDTHLLARHAREQRCLIPVRGYFEQGHCIQVQGQSTFALAGVWREFVGQKQFVVVTTRPNSLIKTIHDRMPCLVAEEDFALWLEGTCEEALAKVCVPYASEAMTITAVTKELELIEAKAVQGSLF